MKRNAGRLTRRTIKVVTFALSACFTVVLAESGRAQTAEPKIVVTFPPRTGGDILTHAIADQIGKTHGLRFAIENASPDAGTASVAHAAPDGNTLIILNNNFVVDSHFRKLAFDPLTDFEPICKLAIAQALIVVSSSSPYKTVADLVRGSNDHPGEITMTALPGGISHIGLEDFKQTSKANMTFVPIPGAVTAVGAPPQLLAVLNGQVTASLQTYQNSAPHLKAGTLRALAVTTRKRLEPLPDIPAVAESGFNYDLDFWDGVFAPAKTPKEKLAQLAGWFQAALNDQDVRSKIGVQAFVPDAICGGDFVTAIRSQRDHYGELIRAANIKP